MFCPILEALTIGLEVVSGDCVSSLKFLNQGLAISQSPEFIMLYPYNIFKFPTALDGRNT